MRLLKIVLAGASLLGETQFVSATPALKGYGVGYQKAYTPGQPVRTSSGTVIGKAAANRNQVSEYLGIPFAQPPVGNLRFAAPQPYVGLGAVNATQFVSLSCSHLF